MTIVSSASAISLSIDAGPLDGDHALLLGPDASRQLVIMGSEESGKRTDWTRSVEYTVAPEGIIKVSKTGEVTPLGNGKATLTASAESIPSATVHFEVRGYEKPLPVNFPNAVVPLFTKFSCNSGGCHGKSEGQNGFRLSLLGFTPTEDYEYLVKEARGRETVAGQLRRHRVLQKAGSARRLKPRRRLRSMNPPAISSMNSPCASNRNIRSCLTHWGKS